MRTLPTHELEVRLLVVDEGGERELGGYVFHHRPWRGHGAAGTEPERRGR